MGRPAKAVSTLSRHITKEEKEVREEIETKLKGEANNIKPFRYLSKSQKKIFKFIVSNLNKDILGNLDIYVLNQTAITIDRLQQIEQKLNVDIELVLNSNFKAMRDMYSKEFFRCCNELSLSPQARAKLSIAITPPTKKTLMDIIGDDNDE